MAYSFVWPPTLPQSPQKGFTETAGVRLVRTSMDAGIAKTRKRGSKPNTLNLSFIMTTAQTTTLESFVKTTIQGTARFGFTHPRLGVIVETRIVPQQDGELFSLSYAAPGFWSVQLTLEVLP